MKLPINVITTLKRVPGEDGKDHFIGTLEPSVLKKARASEIDIVLMPLESIPNTLVHLMSKSGIEKNSLIMFANTGSPAATDKKERKGK
jgi:hypothetical protein